MAELKIADILTAEIWTPEMFNEAPVLKNVLESGLLVVGNNELSTLVNANGAGKRFEMPYIDELDYAEPEYMDDSDNELSVNNFSGDTAYAVVTMAQKSWGYANIIRDLERAGSNSLEVFTNIIGNYWGYDLQNRTIAIAKGLADKAGDALTLDVADDSSDGADVLLIPSIIVDGISKQGDNQDKFGFMFLHSKVYADLKKQNLIDTVIPSDNTAKPIQMYGNYRVVVNDLMPVIQGDNKKKYVTLISQSGLLAYADKTMSDDMPIFEKDRNPRVGYGGGSTALITRRGFAVHPIGWSYTKTMNPTLADLGNKDNWTMKFKAKQQKFVAIITN